LFCPAKQLVGVATVSRLRNISRPALLQWPLEEPTTVNARCKERAVTEVSGLSVHGKFATGVGEPPRAALCATPKEKKLGESLYSAQEIT
jgi:hypothetical protein